MHHFDYRDAACCAEGVNSQSAQSVSTPFYCCSTATIRQHYRVFADAFAGTDALVCYHADESEFQSGSTHWQAEHERRRRVRRRVERAPPGQHSSNKILFSGVGIKTADELRLALSRDILSVNVRVEPSSDTPRRSPPR